jgi:integrase/recombinase XerD
MIGSCPIQYRREPLTTDGTNCLANICEPHEEKLVIWTLLNTGLRVSELANLRTDSLEWQNHRLMVYGKEGPYSARSKRRLIPLSASVQSLLQEHFALYDTLGMTPRTMQCLVKAVANSAHIRLPATPYVLRYTFSVIAIQKGISLPALQRVFGHDRLTTMESYLNLSPEEVLREFREKW